MRPAKLNAATNPTAHVDAATRISETCVPPRIARGGASAGNMGEMNAPPSSFALYTHGETGGVTEDGRLGWPQLTWGPPPPNGRAPVPADTAAALSVSLRSVAEGPNFT